MSDNETQKAAVERALDALWAKAKRENRNVPMRELLDTVASTSEDTERAPAAPAAATPADVPDEEAARRVKLDALRSRANQAAQGGNMQLFYELMAEMRTVSSGR
jgi:hypothetical protein